VSTTVSRLLTGILALLLLSAATASAQTPAPGPTPTTTPTATATATAQTGEPAGASEEPAPDATATPTSTPGGPAGSAPSAATSLPARVAPIILRIPSIGVDAPVMPVGEDEDGAMSAPPLPQMIFWWSLGYGTGEEPANVVLSGHVNWDYGRTLGAFARLDRLQPGDQVYVVDELAREYRYAVVAAQWVRAEGAPVEDIFRATGGAQLTLITCGGAFDPATLQYLDRLVVHAVKI
jgi:LPXTG-site transpeptidase (sortase) family protein